jgi:hypothetical protein
VVSKQKLADQELLVGGWNIFYFPYILEIRNPTDSYFSEGWRKTTNQGYEIQKLRSDGPADTLW